MDNKEWLYHNAFGDTPEEVANPEKRYGFALVVRSTHPRPATMEATMRRALELHFSDSDMFELVLVSVDGQSPNRVDLCWR